MEKVLEIDAEAERREEKQTELMQRHAMDMEIKMYRGHTIADEDSIQALLLSIYILNDLCQIHTNRHISIDDINYEWFLHRKYTDAEMAEYLLRKNKGMLWNKMMQKLIDKTLKALNYQLTDAAGQQRVKTMIFDAAEHIDELEYNNNVYTRVLYRMYSNMLGTYYNELSPVYWDDKEKEEKGYGSISNIRERM